MQKLVVGVDEVGWGALAGPLVVGVVAFPAELADSRIRDSKMYKNAATMSAHGKRSAVVPLIHARALFYNLYHAEPEWVSQAPAWSRSSLVRAAFKDALWSLPGDQYELDLVMDGQDEDYHIPGLRCLPKADMLVTAVAAASVIAKVFRDDMMIRYASQYPEYDFENNKGYMSGKHTEALTRVGPSPIHRPRWLRKMPNVRSGPEEKGA